MRHVIYYLIVIQHLFGNGVTDSKEEIQTAEGTGTIFVAPSQSGSDIVFSATEASILGSATTSFERPDISCQPSQSNDFCSHQRALAMQVLPPTEQAEGTTLWYMRLCLAAMLRQLLCPQPEHAAPSSMELHRMDGRRRRIMELCNKIFQVAKKEDREVTQTSQEEQGELYSARLRPPMECQGAAERANGHVDRQWCAVGASRRAAAEPCFQAQGEGGATQSGGGRAHHCRDYNHDSDVQELEPGCKEVRPGKREISRSSKRKTQSPHQMELLHRGEREKMEIFRRGFCFKRRCTGRQGPEGERSHADREGQPRDDQGAPFEARRSFPRRRHGGAVRCRRGSHESGVSRSNSARHCVNGEQLGCHQNQASRRGECRSQRGQETKTGARRAWLCFFAAFWQAEQVDRNETCSGHIHSLCLHDSQHQSEVLPAIWNHSILEEECFLNPWHASICALDLSYEVGTWSLSST